ncbi:MAG: hypothetical protein EOQ39_18680 [Mesorhizobium sp.]|uniref:hypothetical protein n=1 Tax=Mesorhizobium sp. TaxID=1871066 RepID=UPI000FE8AC6C|nr:hypothetical protein [Mesorhizobium sp.]RWB08803.1 MAG: hypothetical protein EOQ37_04660 [Mesorhizobium sp.]RWB13546.1 MAG: hypothetical protein EOQ39_18680 [Mesorhizobium sp.]
MTPQEIFDKVATHLLTQNAKSQDLLGGTCLYRGSKGLTCAVGCLISDEAYAKGMEGSAFTNLMEVWSMRLPVWFPANQQLLAALQRCHDSLDVDHWRSRLAEIADDFGLEFK